MTNHQQARKRACDSCHNLKIFCDGAQPYCSWCHHRGLRCTYPRASKGTQKIKARHASSSDLMKRIERVELALHAARKKIALDKSQSESHKPQEGTLLTESGTATDTVGASSQSEATSPQAPSSGVHFAKLDFASNQAGEVDSFNGIPFFSGAGYSWVRFRTGAEPCYEKLYALGPPWQDRCGGPARVPADDSPTPIAELKLPPKQTMEYLVSTYCSSSFSLSFPIIDPVLFQHTLDAAYEPLSTEQPSKSVGAKACLFAFLSLKSKCGANWLFPPQMDGERYAAKAKSLVPEIFLEPSLVTFQTLFMLSLHYLLSGNIDRGMTLHAYSCRVLFSLGAHSQRLSTADDLQTDGARTDTQRMKKHLRQLFWMVYSLDKYITLRTGNPPTIDDDFCDLTLPEDSRGAAPSEAEGSNGSPNGSDTGHKPLLLWDLRLAILKSKVSKTLYSPSALRKTDVELLQNIRELDEELERWRMSLDPSCRPSLGFQGEKAFLIDQADDVHVSLQRNVKQFEYHYLLAAIHRASGRCSSWASGEPGDLTGISSSIAISVQASRMTIVHLHAVINFVAEEAFWLIVFYPVSAALTVFCNVLLDPHNPQVDEDLQLIASVPYLIRRMPKGLSSVQDEGYLDKVDEFVAELVRLGNCAVARGSPNSEGK